MYMRRLFLNILSVCFVLIFIIGAVGIAQAQTYWVGATSTNWGTASNWSTGVVPSSTTDVVIGDSHFTGTNSPRTNINSTCRSLTVGGGARAVTLTISSRLYCSGSMTINSNGTINHTGGVDLRLTGNWSSSGTYTTGTNNATRVYFNGTGTQNVSGTTNFRSFYVASGTTVLQNPITVNGTFTVAGGTFDPQTYLVTLNGTRTFSGGTARVQTATFAGNYSANPSTNPTSTFDYNTTALNQTISSAISYNSITINGAGSVKSLSANTTIRGNVTVTSGTLDLGIYTANRLFAGGTFSVAAAGYSKLAGTFPTNYTTYTFSTGSTVEYYGSNAQTVSNRTYYNLIINKSGATATLAGNTTSSGTLTVTSGSTLNIGTYTLTVSGNLVDNGTISGTTGPILLSGATKTIDGSGQITSTGTITISGGNKTILSTANLTITAGTIAINTAITVTNNGAVTTNASGGITGADASSTWVNATNSTLNIFGPLLAAGTLTASAAPNTINYDGTSAQTVKGTVYNNLIITKSSSTGTVDANTSVNSNLTIASGTLDGSTFTLNVAGNIANAGTLTSSGLVQITGNGSNVSGGGTFTFNNLTISGTTITVSPTAGATINGNLTISGTNITLNPSNNVIVAGDLAVSGAGFVISTSSTVSVGGNISTTGAGALTANAGTISMTGSGRAISGSGISFNNFTIAGSGSVSTSSSFTIAGNFTADGSFIANAGIITLSGTSNSISGGGSMTFSKLTITGSLTCSSDFTINSDLSIAGSLTASSGTITFAGTSTLSGTANLYDVTLNGTKLQLGANTVLGIADNFTVTSGTFDLTTTTPNTVNFNGGGQNIFSTTYYNLMLSGSGTKAALGNLTINGNLTIANGVSFDDGGFTHSIYRDIIDNGLITSSGNIQLVGSTDASITGNTTTFSTLTINKSSTSNIITLNSDVNVTNVVMTQGMLVTGNHSITITSDRSGPGSILVLSFDNIRLEPERHMHLRVRIIPSHSQTFLVAPSLQSQSQ